MCVGFCGGSVMCLFGTSGGGGTTSRLDTLIEVKIFTSRVYPCSFSFFEKREYFCHRCLARRDLRRHSTCWDA